MVSHIHLQQVNKAFSDKVLFANLSYTFEQQTYHLIGKNGTGKSTLLRLIAGLEAPDSGTVILNGHNLITNTCMRAKNLFYVPDDLAIYPFLTGKELLLWLAKARTRNVNEVNLIVEQLELQPHLNTRIAEMSLGTKKKFLLSTALIGQPDFIILDEPFNGLDKYSQQTLLILLQKKALQCGLLLTTHQDALLERLKPIQVELEGRRLSARICEKQKDLTKLEKGIQFLA